MNDLVEKVKYKATSDVALSVVAVACAMAGRRCLMPVMTFCDPELGYELG